MIASVMRHSLAAVCAPRYPHLAVKSWLTIMADSRLGTVSHSPGQIHVAYRFHGRNTL
jgi:hypothetical protein